jgi:transposase
MVGKPYSEEYRRRVLEEVAEGNSRRGAARRFKVGVSSAIRWQKQMEETGSATPQEALAAGGACGLAAGAGRGRARSEP